MHDGKLTPDEFDAVYRVLTDKLSHYDTALTNHMIAFRHDKHSKLYKPQCQYWQHCMSAIKDTISYARTLIRVSHESQAVQSIRTDCENGRRDDNSGEDQRWMDT